MYEPDTILTLRVQREPDPETNEAFAYNKVKVIGRSPVAHSAKGDWQGQDAEGVIIVPLSNFGGTLDEPFGKLRELYEVTETPVREVAVEQKIRVIDSSTAAAGPTPEDVFAAEAPGTAPEEGQIRARTSPLGEPGGPAAADGPLGKSPSEIL